MQRRGHQRRVGRGATPQNDGRVGVDIDTGLQSSNDLTADPGPSDYEPLLGRRGPDTVASGPAGNSRRRGSDGNGNLHRNEEVCASPTRHAVHPARSNPRGANSREGVGMAWKNFTKHALKTTSLFLLAYIYLTKVVYIGAPYDSVAKDGLNVLTKASSISLKHQEDKALQFAMLYRDAEEKLENRRLKRKEEWKRRKELVSKKIYDKEQAKKDLELLQGKLANEKSRSPNDRLTASSFTSVNGPLASLSGDIKNSSPGAKNTTNISAPLGEVQKSTNSSAQVKAAPILSRKAKRREKRETLRRVENNATESGLNATRSLTPETRLKMEENLFRESMQGLLVLFCTCLFCMAMRVAANRYIDPNSISPSRLGGREMARSIRQRQRERQRERFNNFVRRLNATRTANGERPMSTESLRLVISDRNFTGDDYESLLQFNEENGHALESILHHSMGATDREIERCPAHVIRSENDCLLQFPSNPALSPKGCSVCLEAYQMGDEVRTIPCFHTFHTRCIDPWLRQKAECPVCKHSAIG